MNDDVGCYAVFSNKGIADVGLFGVGVFGKMAVIDLGIIGGDLYDVFDSVFFGRKD